MLRSAMMMPSDPASSVSNQGDQQQEGKGGSYWWKGRSTRLSVTINNDQGGVESSRESRWSRGQFDFFFKEEETKRPCKLFKMDTRSTSLVVCQWWSCARILVVFPCLPSLVKMSSCGRGPCWRRASANSSGSRWRQRDSGSGSGSSWPDTGSREWPCPVLEWGYVLC